MGSAICRGERRDARTPRFGDGFGARVRVALDGEGVERAARCLVAQVVRAGRRRGRVFLLLGAEELHPRRRAEVGAARDEGERRARGPGVEIWFCSRPAEEARRRIQHAPDRLPRHVQTLMLRSRLQPTAVRPVATRQAVVQVRLQRMGGGARVRQGHVIAPGRVNGLTAVRCQRTKPPFAPRAGEGACDLSHSSPSALPLGGRIGSYSRPRDAPPYARPQPQTPVGQRARATGPI